MHYEALTKIVLLNIVIQWNLYIADTHGPSLSVLYMEVSFVRRLKYFMHIISYTA